MEPLSESDLLTQAQRAPYVLGLLLCVAWPLALEILLGFVPPCAPSTPSLVESIGHTFTGLIFLAAAYVFWRKQQVKRQWPKQAFSERKAALRRETFVAVGVFAVCSLLGPLYFSVAGRSGERHARSYIATVPIMFFIFVPRIQSWEGKAPEA